MSTIVEMLVRDPWGRVPSRALRRLLAVLVVGLMASSVNRAMLIETDYFRLAPGNAPSVDGFLQVEQGRRFEPTGDLLLATVRLGPANNFDALRARLDPDVDLVAKAAILGTGDRDQYQKQTAKDMIDSQSIATAVALHRLGMPVKIEEEGAAVEQVVPDTPAAAARLYPGDVIVEVAGTPVANPDQFVTALRTHRAGESVPLGLDDGDGRPPRRVTVTLADCADVTVAAPEGGERNACAEGVTSGPFLGVQTGPKIAYQPEFDVRIDAEDIGGPSAGLAFTLGLIDALSPGDLTGGTRVAATGTISIDGTVGEIGGLVQKVAAVKAAGAKVFLVPEPRGETEEARRLSYAQYDQAVARAGDDLEIIPVLTLQDAIAALGRVGGDITALGPPPAG